MFVGKTKEREVSSNKIVPKRKQSASRNCYLSCYVSFYGVWIPFYVVELWLNNTRGLHDTLLDYICAYMSGSVKLQNIIRASTHINPTLPC